MLGSDEAVCKVSTGDDLFSMSVRSAKPSSCSGTAVPRAFATATVVVEALGKRA